MPTGRGWRRVNQLATQRRSGCRNIFLGSEFLDFSETFCVRTDSLNQMTCPHFCAQRERESVVIFWSRFSPLTGQNASKKKQIPRVFQHNNRHPLEHDRPPLEKCSQKTRWLHSSRLKLERYQRRRVDYPEYYANRRVRSLSQNPL